MSRRKKISLSPVSTATLESLIIGNRYRVRLSEKADHSVGKWIEATWDGRYFHRAMIGYDAQYSVEEAAEIDWLTEKHVAHFSDNLRYMNAGQLKALQDALNEERGKRAAGYVGRPEAMQAERGGAERGYFPGTKQ